MYVYIYIYIYTLSRVLPTNILTHIVYTIIIYILALLIYELSNTVSAPEVLLHPHAWPHPQVDVLRMHLLHDCFYIYELFEVFVFLIYSKSWYRGHAARPQPQLFYAMHLFGLIACKNLPHTHKHTTELIHCNLDLST